MMVLLEKIFQSVNRTLYDINEPTRTHWKYSDIDKIILLAGVYDITKHYEWESCRAVEEISTMKPAMRGYLFFSQYSPTIILKCLVNGPNFYDSIKLSHEDMEIILGRFKYFPRVELLHSRKDGTVPCSSSARLYKYLAKVGVPSVNITFDEYLEHSDWVFGLMGYKRSEQVIAILSSILPTNQ